MLPRTPSWRPLSPVDAPAVEALLARSDADWGNVVERSADDVRRLVASASGGVRVTGGGLDAVALEVPGDEVLVRADRDLPDRSRALDEAISTVEAALSAGTPLWLPAADHEAAAAARLAGLAPAYTDLQMRTSLPPATNERPALPPAHVWRDVRRHDPSLGDEVHDLVCVAWDVPPHREAFRERFEGADADPRLWVLADQDGVTPPLVAAALGQVLDLPDGRFGVVAHLDVHPRARRLGLGTAALGELLRRFRQLGLEQAQLGVHDDNASRAPEMYRALGWRVVSSQTKWVTAPPCDTSPVGTTDAGL